MVGHRKFNPKWLGPFTVAQRVGEIAYCLNLPPSMKLHPVFNVSRLKPWVAGGGDGVEPPPPVLDTGQGLEYEIDRIVAERGSGRRK